MKRTIFSLCLIFAFLFAVVGGAYSAETLRLITWSGYTPKVLLDKFEKETGIKVMPTNSSNEEMIAKLRATRGAAFDLAQPSQDRISSVQEKFQIYQPIDLSKIKTEQIIPSMLEAVKNNTMVGDKPHAVPFCWGSSGLVVNRKLAPDVQDYDDLLNKKYAGRISYRLKRPTLIALAFAMGDDPFAKYVDANAYEALMEKVGQALIEAKGLVQNYWTNGDALLQALMTEEVYLAMAWDKGGWKVHAEKPEVDFFAPKSGALGWINFILRPENAAEFTNSDTTANCSKGANQFVKVSIRSNFERSFTPENIENIKWYPPVPAKLEEIEGKILDKVKAAK
jgi:spermidine/putrescine transport system substrate-binding protein